MIAILVILGLVGLVWGTVLALRGSLLAGCLTYLILASVFGPYFFSFDAGITWTIDRVFFLILVGAFCVQWRLGLTDSKPLTYLDYLLFVFIGWLALSTFTHDYSVRGPSDIPIVQHLINGYLIPLTIFWIARQVRLTEQNTKWLLGGFCVFACYLAVIGVCEASGQWWAVYPTYIRDPELGLHFGRSRGPMMQSITYGAYLGVGVLCAWLLRERLGSPTWMLPMLLIPLLCAAIYFTKTRSVWLGSACGLLMMWLFTLKGRLRIALVGGAVAAGLLVGILKIDSIMSLQREGTVADTHQSTNMRGSFAYVSWKMFLDKPILGFGFGQFATQKRPYLSDRSVDMQLEQIRGYVHHSTFLAVLTETGLIGLVLFLSLLGGWITAAVKLIRHQQAPPWVRHQGMLMISILCLYFWQMVGHEITFTPLDNSLIYCLAGIVVGLYAKEKSHATEGLMHRPSLAPRYAQGI